MLLLYNTYRVCMVHKRKLHTTCGHAQPFICLHSHVYKLKDMKGSTQWKT